MLPSTPHNDARMQQIQRDLTDIRSELDGLYTFLYTVPPKHRARVWKSLSQAMQLGLRFAKIDHNRMPIAPPRDLEGHMEIGPELRDHMRHMREMYGEIHDVRSRLTDFLEDHDALQNASDRIAA